MRQNELRYKIFDLSPEKFEELCHLLLKAEFKFEKAYILDISSDEGVDILAYNGEEKIGISVKHKYSFNRSKLQAEINKISSILENYNKFIFITSAIIDNNIIAEFESNKISIFAQNELVSLLYKHNEVALRYFKIAEQKKRKINYWLNSSIAGLLMSVFASLITLIIDKEIKDNPLSQRIENVEQALKSIQSLEKDLEGIKEDMIKTDIENKRILEEYEKMRGIEKIINEQKESLKLVLNYEPWYKKILNYFFGIITGIFSSIIAAIIWNRWKQFKSLKK